MNICPFVCWFVFRSVCQNFLIYMEVKLPKLISEQLFMYVCVME